MWVSAFLDFPDPVFEAAAGFWRQVTGARLSASRGERGEFETLLPDEGDPWLRVQRLGEGAPRVHLDVHADDPDAVRRRVADLGGRQVADFGHTVHTSPGGLLFCVVDEQPTRPPQPVAWPHLSRVDQVCIDIPEAAFDTEAHFWAALLQRQRQPSTHPEFERLADGAGDWPQLLLQRCGFEVPVRAHLDIACEAENRDTEVARISDLGASFVRRTDDWTTLRDPAGLEFCVTDRDPRSGRLAPRR